MPPAPNEPTDLFEYELLIHLIRIPKLGIQFADAIQPQDFRKPWMRVVWNCSVALFRKHRQWPEQGQLRAEFENLYDGKNLDANDRPLLDQFQKDCHENPPPLDREYFHANAIQWLEQKRVGEIYKNLNWKKIPGIEEAILQLTNAGRNIPRAVHPTENPLARIEIAPEPQRCSTGFESIDSQLPNNAVHPGSTILFYTKDHRSRSRLLRSLEYRSVKHGQKVLAILYRDAPEKTKKQFYCMAAGIPWVRLYRPEGVKELTERIEQHVQELKGEYRILSANDFTNTPFETPNLKDLWKWIEKETNRGFRPHLITIDHADSHPEELSATLTRCQNLAQHLQCIVFIGTTTAAATRTPYDIDFTFELRRVPEASEGPHSFEERQAGKTTLTEHQITLSRSIHTTGPTRARQIYLDTTYERFLDPNHAGIPVWTGKTNTADLMNA